MNPFIHPFKHMDLQGVGFDPHFSDMACLLNTLAASGGVDLDPSFRPGVTFNIFAQLILVLWCQTSLGLGLSCPTGAPKPSWLVFGHFPFPY